MNKRNLTILLSAAAGVAVLGTVAYVATRPPKKKKKKPTQESGPAGISLEGMLRLTGRWDESLRAEAESRSHDRWVEVGRPAWSHQKNVDIARSVAMAMYPMAQMTRNNTWPGTTQRSETWIDDAQKSQNLRTIPGSQAWQQIMAIVATTMGYSPVI